jgi:hypothetical protein
MALCRLQKPPRIYVEKSLEEILHNMDKPIPAIIHQQGHPGDRDDNLWVTIDDYKPSRTQIEWEETCFLDKSFHGYYTWPKTIKYTLNKRTRYTKDNMPEEVAILYDRFIDKNFVRRTTQLMILDEKKDEKYFDKNQVTIFKVINNDDHINKFSFRVSFVISVWHFLTTSWNNYLYSFMKKQKRNKKVAIEEQLK